MWSDYKKGKENNKIWQTERTQAVQLCVEFEKQKQRRSALYFIYKIQVRCFILSKRCHEAHRSNWVNLGVEINTSQLVSWLPAHLGILVP